METSLGTADCQWGKGEKLLKITSCIGALASYTLFPAATFGVGIANGLRSPYAHSLESSILAGKVFLGGEMIAGASGLMDEAEEEHCGRAYGHPSTERPILAGGLSVLTYGAGFVVGSLINSF